MKIEEEINKRVPRYLRDDSLYGNRSTDTKINFLFYYGDYEVFLVRRGYARKWMAVSAGGHSVIVRTIYGGTR